MCQYFQQTFLFVVIVSYENGYLSVCYIFGQNGRIGYHVQRTRVRDTTAAAAQPVRTR